MTPLQAAARFAAFVWYTENRNAPRRVARAEARRFAQESWKAFLPVAHEGLGRLLLEVARLPVPANAGANGRHCPAAANRSRTLRLAAAV